MKLSAKQLRSLIKEEMETSSPDYPELDSEEFYFALVNASSDASGEEDLADEMVDIIASDPQWQHIPEDVIRDEVLQHIEDHEEDWNEP